MIRNVACSMTNMAYIEALVIYSIEVSTYIAAMSAFPVAEEA